MSNLHTKRLSRQEQEVVSDLEAKLVEIETQLKVLDAQRSELRSEQTQAHSQLNEITSPFAVGEIVADEQDIKYRVTRITGSRPYGIRLNASGAEAYKDPRVIWSNKLVPVND